MRVFTALYERVMNWAAHRHAPWYLSGLSIAESSFFPIPPDVMLAPMCLARLDRAYFYAALTTITSVVGGIIGYLIGWLAFESIEPLLHQAGYWDSYLTAREWYDEWGVWVVFLAGFSPIPYKVFTISSGVAAMAFLPFVLASLVGRGVRFFLVAALMVWGGEDMKRLLLRYVDMLGWAFVIVAALGFVIYKLSFSGAA